MKDIMSNILRIGKDFILNIGASILMVLATQLIVYPAIAIKLNTDMYGLFLTLMGIAAMLAGAIGNSLNNVRIIMNNNYNYSKQEGDFSILLLFGIFIIVIVFILFLNVFTENLTSSLMYLLLVVIMTIRAYYSVAFRIKINYKYVFVMNFILSIAYICITGWYYYFGIDYKKWILIFLIAEVTATIYVFAKSNLWKETFQITSLFPVTLKKYLNLIYLTIISSLLLYFDRNLLYPLLGGKAVAVYFTASLVGKTIGIFVGPISNVLLSYFSQADFKMDIKKFWHINLLITGFGAIGYIFSLLVSDFIVKVFYLDIYFEAREFFPLANLVPILNVIADMARPTVLKFVELSKLSIVQTIFFILTFVVSYYTVTTNGLYGFCCGAIGVSLFRVMAMWFLGHLALCKGK